MSHIVTKQTKSEGIAILLVILLGPFGMFYSTIAGAIFMILFFPTLFLTAETIIPNLGEVLTFPLLIVTYIISAIWSAREVSKYNYAIELEEYQADNTNNLVAPQVEKNNIYESLERVKSLHSDNILSSEEYEKQKNEYLERLKILNANLSNRTYYEDFNKAFNSNKKNKNGIIWVVVLLTLLAVFSISYLIFKKKSNLIERGSPQESLSLKNSSLANNPVTKSLNGNEHALSISHNSINNKNITAWKVTSYENENTGISMEELNDKYFVFDDKKIYLIENRKVIEIWSEKEMREEFENEIIYTTDGSTFEIFGTITYTPRKGKSIVYKCDQFPITTVAIDDEYISK